MKEIRIGNVEAFPPGTTHIVDVGDTEIAVINQDGKLHAYLNVCPHQGGPVCEGVRIAMNYEEIDEQGRYHGMKFDPDTPLIVCPWHGYSYRLDDGSCVADSNLTLRKFEIEIREESVIVRT